MFQYSIFDLGSEPKKITKPIRLIELFAGYGSQHLSLKYLGANFESWKIAEWAVPSIQAYKDGHFREDKTDYSKQLSKERVVEYLFNKGVSTNYNEPMTKDQIQRKGESWQRSVYNDIIATKNLVSVCNVKGSDLEIVGTDKYEYIMTYSFPCQDLSKAGQGRGMAKDSGTRSGLLWEVERILNECTELPQVLVMENVPDVHGENNKLHFYSWLRALEKMGYSNYWQDLNAKDYDVPQNRDRCFMVSLLGDYNYDFPKRKILKVRLKDILEQNVDEKYYLSERALSGCLNTTFNCSSLENRLPQNGIMPTICARDYKDPKLIQVAQLEGTFKSCNRVYGVDGLSPTVKTMSGGGLEPKIAEPKVLTPKRNEYGKQIRKDYENGKIRESRHKMTELEPRDDGISNTLTTVTKDNYLAEPIIYDDYNGRVKSDQSCINTLTTNCGNDAERNGVKIVEFLDRAVVDSDGECCGFDPSQSKTFGYRKPIKNISRTLRAENNMCGSIIENYRIRKLTPRECFRLMGVRDEDYEAITRRQSNSSQYHLAGDSIVVDVLMAIFKEMIGDNNGTL